MVFLYCCLVRLISDCMIHAHVRTSDLHLSFFCFAFSCSCSPTDCLYVSLLYCTTVLSLSVCTPVSLFSHYYSSLCLSVLLNACHSAQLFSLFRLSAILLDCIFFYFRLPASLLHCLSSLLISNGASICQSACLLAWSPLVRLSASLLCLFDLPWSVFLPVCLSALLISPCLSVCQSACLRMEPCVCFHLL